MPYFVQKYYTTFNFGKNCITHPERIFNVSIDATVHQNDAYFFKINDNIIIYEKNKYVHHHYKEYIVNELEGIYITKELI